MYKHYITHYNTCSRLYAVSREDRVQSPDEDCLRGRAGVLEDGIDDPELQTYFSEFGALRIPNKDGPKEKFGFVDFDDYDAVDMVIQQREHYVCGHKVKVELALPLINDTLYDCPGAMEVTTETWEEQVFQLALYFLKYFLRYKIF